MTSSDIRTATGVMALGSPPMTARDGRAIFHPIVDFLCLGGVSLFLLPMAMMLPETSAPTVSKLMFLAAILLNNPHFAISYQIFYRGYRDKAFGDTLKRGMRIRYIVAGLVVPIVLLALFAIAFTAGDAQMLGWGGNLMMLFVGWHYAKQGYGMLIVDSVYRRRFFTDREKSVFLYNAYTCWMTSWLFANQLISERNLWGLAYYSFDVPHWALYASVAATLFTTILTFGIFARRLRGESGGLPVSGAVAYVTTLYIWFAARYAPIAFLIVPALHSLQYLLIVSRYEINHQRALVEQAESGGRNLGVRLFRLAFTAVALGFAGFWLVPMMLDAGTPYDHAIFGETAFLFMFWIFINVHHYFIDNVIWRRENPDTSAHLFGPKPARA